MRRDQGAQAAGSGTLNLTGAGITQIGAIVQAASAGAVTLATNAATTDILLGSQPNDFSGSINFGGTLTNLRDFALRSINASAVIPSLSGLTNLRNLTLVFDNAAIALPTLGNSGNLSIAAGGAITQIGALMVNGTSSFLAGANLITLTLSNVFTGAITLNNSGANDVSLTNSIATQFDTSSIGGNLTVSAAGAITQLGAFTVAGISSFSAGANAITLTNAFNLLQGAVSLNNSGINNATINNNMNLIFGTTTIGNILNVVTTSGGSVTQTGIITAPTLNITSSGGINLPLANAPINFSAINTSGDVIFNNTGSALDITGITQTGGGFVHVTNDQSIDVTGAITTDGGATTLNAATGMTLDNTITIAGGSGDSIVLSGTTFTNNAGVSALNPGAGRFLVWSGDPANDNRGGIVYDFKQYNATYGVSTVLGTGNGFLYTLAPVVTPILSGIVSKIYDGIDTAFLTNANFTTNSGAVDGDTVTLNIASIAGNYDTKNAGTNKTVTPTLSGVTVASATNGAATVYGYQTSSAAVSQNIGTITQASLTISSNAGQNKVYGTDDPLSVASAYGVVGLQPGDSVTGNLGRTAGENVGLYNFLQGSIVVNDGNGGNNYSTTFDGTTNKFQITQAALSINPDVGQSKVYGANDPALGFTYSNTGLINGVTPQYWDATGTLVNDTTINDTISGNLGRAAGENVGNYNYVLGSVAASSASNYLASLTAGTFAIIQTALSINPGVGQSKVYGTNDSASGFAYSNTGLVNGVTPQYWDATGTLVNDTTINDTLSGNLGRISGENVGNYNYVLGSVAVSAPSNYTTSLTAGTFAITQAALSINPGVGQNKVYGTNDSASGFAYSNTGLVNGVTPQYWDATGTLVNDTTINDTLSGNLGRAAGENVGNYNYVLGSVAASSASNYLASLTAGTFAIIQTALSINPGVGQSKVYGTNDSASGFAYSNTGLVNGVTPQYWDATGTLVNDTTINDTLSGNLGRAAGENVGSYAYNLGSVVVSAPSNYNTSLTAGTFAITQASLSINPDVGQNKVYGTDDTASGFAYSNTGLVNGVTPQYWDATGTLVNDTAINDTISGKLGRAAGENVGSYAYNLGSVVVSAPSNYNTSLTAGTFAITQAALSINPDVGQNKVYGTDDTASGFAYSNTGLVNGVTPQYWDSTGTLVNGTTINDTLSGNLGRISGENVGNYNYVLGSVAVSAPSNYTTSLTAGTFAITQAALSINPDVGQNKVYGTDDPALGFTYSSTGLINGVTPQYWDNTGALVNATAINDTVSGNLGRAAGENVGNYSYVLGSVVANTPGNYNMSIVPGTFSITPASLTIIPTAGQQKIYGAVDPVFIYGNTGLVHGITPQYWDASGTLVNATTINDLLSGSLGRTAGENVGSYPFSIGSVAVNVPANYNAISFTPETFGITPATLMYVANPVVISPGSPIPPVSGGVTGFVNGDMINTATTGTLVFNTSAVSNVPGLYAINGSGLTPNSNYILVQAPGNATAFSVQSNTPMPNPAPNPAVVASILNNGWVYSELDHQMYYPMQSQSENGGTRVNMVSLDSLIQNSVVCVTGGSSSQTSAQQCVTLASTGGFYT